MYMCVCDIEPCDLENGQKAKYRIFVFSIEGEAKKVQAIERATKVHKFMCVAAYFLPCGVVTGQIFSLYNHI